MINKEIYIIYKLSTTKSIKMKMGLLNDYFDRSWSDFIFDKDFKLLDEIYMEPKNTDFPIWL
jgi:hypothetical protein